ncbi:hypothetical protein llap_2057 [Limosa lapponica baueri]|uniref:Uncharacterized protein n=1 Tax=Limosa lapponica baueri TaxID=1758121 RepID=A0A2I0UNN0_LIMLA|nr:hypothetical protein llap_2057 [Limosa lapponica baueri]
MALQAHSSNCTELTARTLPTQFPIEAEEGYRENNGLASGMFCTINIMIEALNTRKRSNFGADKDEKLRARSQRRNLAWVLGLNTPASLADAALVLPQLSLAYA